MSQLFKQKYFCQICDRQCRDKDGFSCHLKSNTHRINMEYVASNPDEYINKYSYEFEKGYLDIMRREYPDSFVNANKVYQEYIRDKTATHLNATRWTSLTAFVHSLEKKDKVKIKCNTLTKNLTTMKETTDKEDAEISIKLIEVNPATKLLLEKKIKEEKLEEIKNRKEFAKNKNLSKLKDNKYDNSSKSILINSNKSVSDKNNNHNEKNNSVGPININIMKIEKINPTYDSKILFPQDNSNNLIENKSEELLGKKRLKENEIFDMLNTPWIQQNLVVTIKDKDLDCFNSKGKILQVVDEFVAEVRIIDTGIVIRIDQAYLEPFIPSLNDRVSIIFGKYKNNHGKIEYFKDEYTYINLDSRSSIKKISKKFICGYNNDN